MKKIVSWLLAIALIISTLPSIAMADWDLENVPPVATLTVDCVDGANVGALLPGQQVKATIIISGLNKEFRSAQMTLKYNDTMFELERVDEYGDTYFDKDSNCKDFVTIFGSNSVALNDGTGFLTITAAA